MSATTLYYLQTKKENAHEDSIWCCGWSKIEHDKQKDIENFENIDDNQNLQDTDNSPTSENYIITGGLDDIIKVWQLDNGKLVVKHQLEGHSLGIISVAVSPDGKTLASSSQESSLILWDIATGEKIKSFETVGMDVWTLDFSPDGKHVISGSNAGKILIFGVESGKQEQVLDTRGKFTLSVAYSPDGKYIASGALDGIINTFDVAQAKLVHTLEGHAMPIRSLCFSPDSQLLLTASDDGHMKLYDVVHANLAGTLSGHASWVLSVAFSPDGKRFASGSADGTVRVWDLDSMQCQHVFKEHTDQVQYLRVSFVKSWPGMEVAASGRFFLLQLVDAVPRGFDRLIVKPPAKLGHLELGGVNYQDIHVWGVKFNAESSKVVSVSEDKSINVYDCPV